MAASHPNFNDSDRDLWRRIAFNFYSYAVNFGATGLNPPSMNDNINDLQRKTAYITAKAVDLHP